MAHLWRAGKLGVPWRCGGYSGTMPRDRTTNTCNIWRSSLLRHKYSYRLGAGPAEYSKICARASVLRSGACGRVSQAVGVHTSVTVEVWGPRARDPRQVESERSGK